MLVARVGRPLLNTDAEISGIRSSTLGISVSDRPLETVEPLAQAVGVSVQHDIRDKDFEDLVDEIFSDAAYRGKYGRSSSAVARITADVARATTLRVDPA